LKIGEKIKKLRTEKLMTQVELSGDVITRNMLSCIENGSAQPSLATLRHIAAKLNVSVGYLLSDGEEEKSYLKMAQISDIKNAYLSGNLKICRDMCRNSLFENDDEINLLYSECCLGIAEELFSSGKLKSACFYFDEALEVATRTIYNTGHIVAVTAAYFRYIRNISATLTSDVIDETEVEIYSAMNDDFARYIIAFEALLQGRSDMAKTIISGLDASSHYYMHISSRIDMLEEKYDEAYSKLYTILTSPIKIQEPFMYFVFCDLEIVCRERKDFKGAYEYSNDKIELLQKMLTDVSDN
jgi:transcriptional regulator with XRE-family HTH domain